MLKRWLSVGTVLAVAGLAAAQDGSGNTTAAPATTDPAAQPSSTNSGATNNNTGSSNTGGAFTGQQAPTLKIGDKAPAFTIDSWLKGEPVTGFQSGNTYVVEFWATWCHPCRDVIPHLTDLQTLYKDKGVTVIGISSSEPNGLEDVTPFVEKMGDRMNFTVAWDSDGKTESDWMRASGNTAIPMAFIVNGEGLIAWIGHPTHPKGEMDTVLSQVVAGTFDIKAAAEKEAKASEIQFRAQNAWNSGNQREALEILTELVNLDPAKYSSAAMQKFQGLLIFLNDPSAGYAWANTMIDGFYADDAEMLHEIAWTIVQAPSLQNRDLGVAFRAIERAENLTGGVSAPVLDTKARVHFLRGENEQAVELQTKALELVADDSLKFELELRLDEYRRAVANAEK